VELIQKTIFLISLIDALQLDLLNKTSDRPLVF
jgi:hypothetical protein